MAKITSVEESFEELVRFLRIADCVIERKLNEGLARGTGLRGYSRGPGKGHFEKYDERYSFFGFSNLSEFERQLHNSTNELVSKLEQIVDPQSRDQYIQRLIDELWLIKSDFFPDPETGSITHEFVFKNIHGDPPELEPMKIDDDLPLDFQGVEQYVESTFQIRPFIPFISLQYQYLSQVIKQLEGLIENSEGNEKTSQIILRRNSSNPRYKLNVSRLNAKVGEIDHPWPV